jgi:hypothetical protein
MLLKIAIFASIGAYLGYAGTKFFISPSKKCVKTVPDESRIEVLRTFSSYDGRYNKFRHHVKMVLDAPVPDILKKYDYYDYCRMGIDNKDEIVFSMLNFVCDNFKHKSDAVLPSKHSLTALIKSCENSGGMTNCRGLSLILAELLRMNGVMARHVTCKPYEEPFQDCHVVVDCLMPSGARIMLDPTYRLFLTDDNGEYVSLAKLREGIIVGKNFYPNEYASYNGSGFDYSDYIEYMTKNVFRFNTNYRLMYSDSIITQIELIPKGYTTKGMAKIVQYTTNPGYFWKLD